VSIRYTARFAKAGIEPSVGSVGDSYDERQEGPTTRVELYQTSLWNSPGRFRVPWFEVSDALPRYREWEDEAGLVSNGPVLEKAPR